MYSKLIKKQTKDANAAKNSTKTKKSIKFTNGLSHDISGHPANAI